MKAEYVTSAFWHLALRVIVGPNTHKVEYDARGWGEKILVDGCQVVRRYNVFGIPPRLDFEVGGAKASLERNFSKWGAWSALVLTINDEIVYDFEDLVRDDQPKS